MPATKKPAKPAAKKAAPKKVTPKKTVPKKTAPPKAAPKKTTAKKTNAFGPVGFKPYKLKKGEAYMNEAQSEHFRNILDLWKEQLMEGSERTVHHMQDDASNFPDPIDRASQEEEFTLELRTRDRERKLIKRIDSTLALIDEGDYGFCDQCGAEIGIRRLEARPTAVLCIDCKTFQEMREKQTGTY